MKKELLLMICLFVQVISNAQTKATVHYEEKVKFDFKVEGDNAPLMAGLPKEHTVKKVLFYTENASLYKNEKTEDKEQNVETESEGGVRMVIQMDEPDDIAYCDLKNNKRIEQRDFMSRKFLIESDLNKMTWKLTGKQKKVLEYPCQEAVLQDTTNKVSVWFTPAIPVSSGPKGFANLPGLILAVDMNEGEVSIVATKVDVSPFDEKLLIKPKEGKKMSKEDFNKMMMEKRKEMESEFGGSGNVIIKVRH